MAAENEGVFGEARTASLRFGIPPVAGNSLQVWEVSLGTGRSCGKIH